MQGIEWCNDREYMATSLTIIEYIYGLYTVERSHIGGGGMYIFQRQIFSKLS